MRASEVMTSEVVTARPEMTFPEIVDLLVRHDITGLPVVDDNGALVGMVSEADVLSKLAYGGRRRRTIDLLVDLVSGGETRWSSKSKGQTAANVMERDVVSAHAAEDVRSLARRMVEGDVKRLPITDKGRLVGIVTRTDLLRVLHRSDDQIQADLERALADPVQVPEAAEVSVTVHLGVVTITGVADTAADRRIIGSLAWRNPAVVDVHNQVTLREPQPTTAH